MNDSLNTIAALLQQHRAAYLQALPARLAQLDTLAGHLDASDEPATLPELERLAHSLAGSAGTFGFSELGEAARTLELAIGEVREGTVLANVLPGSAATLRAQLQRLLRKDEAGEALQ